MKNWTYEKTEARKVNELAREQMKVKILADIRMDMQICEIEGWDRLEYIDDLIKMLTDLRSKNDT